MLDCLLMGLLMYLFIGFYIWISTGHHKNVGIVILIWPYVVYVFPEGRDWYYRKTGLK